MSIDIKTIVKQYVDVPVLALALEQAADQLETAAAYVDQARLYLELNFDTDAPETPYGLGERDSSVSDFQWNVAVTKAAIEHGYDLVFNYTTPGDGVFASPKTRRLRPISVEEGVIPAHTSVFGVDLNAATPEDRKNFRFDRVSGIFVAVKSV